MQDAAPPAMIIARAPIRAKSRHAIGAVTVNTTQWSVTAPVIMAKDTPRSSAIAGMRTPNEKRMPDTEATDMNPDATAAP